MWVRRSVKLVIARQTSKPKMVADEVIIKKEEKKIFFSFREKQLLPFLLSALKSVLCDQTMQGATHAVNTDVANIFFVSTTFLSIEDLSRMSWLMSSREFHPTKEDNKLKAMKAINMTRRTQRIAKP